MLDFEESATRTFTLTASDGTASDSMQVTVTVTNVDDAGSVSIDKGDGYVGTDYTASLTDQDGNVTGATWQWAISTDPSTGTWDDISGEISDTYTPVRDDVNKYLRVTASYTDAFGGRKTANRVTAKVPNRRPVIDGDFFREFTITENLAIGTKLAQFTASDSDGHSITWSTNVSSTSAQVFDVDSDGWLTTAIVLNYEVVPRGHNDMEFMVFVWADDGKGGRSRVIPEVNVTDVAEPGSVSFAGRPSVGAELTAVLFEPDIEGVYESWEWNRDYDPGL